jgi:hypothetical protein
MNTILQRFSGSSAGSRRSQLGVEEDSDFSDAMWGSEAGFGTLAKGVPGFVVPSVPDVGTQLLPLSTIMHYRHFTCHSPPHS